MIRPSSRSTSPSSTADSGAASGPPAVDDDVDHPRHQAQRGHPGTDQRARRDLRRLGRDLRPAAEAEPAARRPTRRADLAGRDRQAWPLSRDRLSAYTLKAAREAGTSTSWTTPDPRFEQAVQAMVDDAYDHPDVVEELESIVDLVRRPGWSNSLAAKLIQLTAPGVPDVYQGTRGLGHLAGRP